ncbi:hypothetical protein [Thermogutta sp.]|uniref:hypothetical protein n=1 Tax=Thermogutta sp. TaxID=1962930 RepID=UPI003C7C81A3
MNSSLKPACEPARAGLGITILVLLAGLLTLLYGSLAALSFRFAPDVPVTERPILAALGILAAAFVAYILAIIVALQTKADRVLLVIIIAASILFRVVSVYSWPILEIDIYRYLWDGNVVAQGVSPYRYSPEQVLQATSHRNIPDDLKRLVQLRKDSSINTILTRVHYAHLPTIYPPVSQAAFAAVAYLTPTRAGVFERIMLMKLPFVVFDLTTLVIISTLLRLSRKHIGWSASYGWCPLVVKEIANTGHLDSLAVFLTVLALFFAVRLLRNFTSVGRSRIHTLLSAVLLALAVGAKFYPVVLAPMVAALWMKAIGWRWASAATLTFVMITTAVLWPMIPWKAQPSSTDCEVINAKAESVFPAVPSDTMTTPQDPSRGLTAFLGHWEINDFLFMLVIENLKPTMDGAPEYRPWFSIVPHCWRAELVAATSRWFLLDPSRTPFLLARLITVVCFLAILTGLLHRVRLSEQPADWLQVAFLLLAWFWLLSPTQNPWYWTWAIPLVMFARSKAWLAIGGLAMVYYLRFWLMNQFPNQHVLSTPYTGAMFFDFVVTWFEYAPWFVWLMLETAWSRPLHREDDRSSQFSILPERKDLFS